MKTLLIVLAILTLLVLRGRALQQQHRAQRLAALREAYGKAANRKLTEQRRAALERFLDRTGRNGLLDAITWNDLDLSRVFEQMDSCASASGEEVLYRKLHDISVSKEELDALEELVSGLRWDAGCRNDLLEALDELGFSGKYALTDYLDYLTGEDGAESGAFPGARHAPAISRGAASEIIRAALFLPLLALALWKPVWGVAGLVLLVSIQVFSYFSEKHKIEKYLAGLSYLIRLERCADRIAAGNYTLLAPEVARIRRYADELSALRRGGSFVLSSDRYGNSSGPIEMLITYLNMLTHADIITFRRLLGSLQSHRESAMGLILALGNLDAAIAIASYRELLEGRGTCCVPELIPVHDIPAESTSGAGLLIEDGIHPLLGGTAVPNTIFADRGILITGSNASGKSTFLRMVAINAILAQTIHTCAAKRYRAPYFRIYSSIALTDNLLGGESYFVVEIKSLKRILDAAQSEGRPVLCFVDEVLRGTNTQERISASAAVLRALAGGMEEAGSGAGGASGGRCMCFAATHDIELTQLLANLYRNIHFEETLGEADISFTYRLCEGPSTTRNAITLLKRMGFSEEITKEAERLGETNGFSVLLDAEPETE